MPEPDCAPDNVQKCDSQNIDTVKGTSDQPKPFTQETSKKKSQTPLFYVLSEVRDSLVSEEHGCLNEVKDRLEFFLHDRWHLMVQDNELHVVLTSIRKPLSIQRDVVFSTNGEVELFVHRQPLDIEPFLKNAVEPVPLTSSNVNDFVQRAAKFLMTLGKWKFVVV